MPEASTEKEGALERLAEARVTVLYLRRLAVERKDKALAESLAVQGAALKERIADLKQSSWKEWASGARGWTAKSQTVQGKLRKIIRQMEKEGATLTRLGKAAALAGDLLSLAG